MIPAKNTNTNCLQGLRCPGCGQFDEFLILGRAIFKVHDDGIEEYESVEWGCEDLVKCPKCNANLPMARFEEAEIQAKAERDKALKIAVVWVADDIIEYAEDIGYTLTESHAAEILYLLQQQHDCNIGITWNIIDLCIQDYTADNGIEKNES